MNILKFLFGTKNDRELKKLWPVVREINRIEQEYQAKNFADEDYPRMTQEFKDRVAKGESLDHILPEGDLFVSVDRSGKETVTKSDNVCVKVPMSVLVNANTYSAAEFFAAALREYDWATIVGENTTGKGRSQTTLLLSDGSAVHISSNKYLTPQRVDLSEQGGLVPDQTVTPGDDPEVDQQLNAAISAVLN